MKDEIKIAVIQMEIKADAASPDVGALNDARALELLEEAVKTNPELIIFPDDFAGGYAYGPLNIPRPLNTPLLDEFKRMAESNGVYIAGAMLVRIETIASKSMGFIITPEKTIYEQLRINTYEEEEQFVNPGQTLEVFDTPLGKIGMAINIDILVPEICRFLKKKGAEIIISPSYFHSVNEEGQLEDYPHCFFQTAARARAMENQVHVIMSNGVGIEYVTKAPVKGESMVITPAGKVSKASTSQQVYTHIVRRTNIHASDFNSFNLENLRKQEQLDALG